MKKTSFVFFLLSFFLQQLGFCFEYEQKVSIRNKEHTLSFVTKVKKITFTSTKYNNSLDYDETTIRIDDKANIGYFLTQVTDGRPRESPIPHFLVVDDSRIALVIVYRSANQAAIHLLNLYDNIPEEPSKIDGDPAMKGFLERLRKPFEAAIASDMYLNEALSIKFSYDKGKIKIITSGDLELATKEPKKSELIYSIEEKKWLHNFGEFYYYSKEGKRTHVKASDSKSSAK